MAGEGRGHASRVGSLVDALRDEYRFVLLASDQAHQFLVERYGHASPGIRIEKIRGMRFLYTRGRLDLTRSVLAGLRFYQSLPAIRRQIEALIDEERPALAVTDFEAALPRAAKRKGIPLVSIDHQHFTVAYDLSILPRGLRSYAGWIAYVTRLHHTHQVATVVSGFFKPPLKKGYEDVVQAGPFLRPELKVAQPTEGGFVLSYLRPFYPERILAALRECGMPVRVYGLGERPADGPLTFFPINEQTYIRDLAACHAYVGAGGNQTLGELVYLGKPVMPIPEPNHHEQLINSHFIRHMGCGDFVTADRVTVADIRKFLARRDEFLDGLAPLKGTLDGTEEAANVIRKYASRGKGSGVFFGPTGAPMENTLTEKDSRPPGASPPWLIDESEIRISKSETNSKQQ